MVKGDDKDNLTQASLPALLSSHARRYALMHGSRNAHCRVLTPIVRGGWRVLKNRGRVGTAGRSEAGWIRHQRHQRLYESFDARVLRYTTRLCRKVSPGKPHATRIRCSPENLRPHCLSNSSEPSPLSSLAYKSLVFAIWSARSPKVVLRYMDITFRDGNVPAIHLTRTAR